MRCTAPLGLSRREHLGYCRTTVNIPPLRSLLGYLMWTSPNHFSLTTSPLLFTLLFEQAQHQTHLSACYLMRDDWVQLATFCNFAIYIFSRKKVCEIKNSTVFIHEFLPKKHSAEGLSGDWVGPRRPDQWCVKWRSGSHNRDVYVIMETHAKHW